MKYLIYMARFIFAFGLYIGLSLVLFAMMPLLWLLCGCNRKRYALLIQDFVHYTFRFVFVYCRLIGFVDLKVIDHSGGQRGRLLVANHISMFDMIAVLATYRHCNTFVNRKFLKNPILYPVIKSCGYIPVDPAKPQEMLAASMLAMDLVKQGATFLVFPEGTRSQTGKLAPFHAGLFKIAGYHHNEYQPIIVTSDRPMFNRTGPLHMWSRAVQFHLHLMPPKPLPAAGCNKKDLLSFVKNTEEEFEKWMQADWVLPYNRQPIKAQ